MARNTFNVSTATAFVVAGAGQRVAKHGNRRISSQCGSADVLEALGISVTLPPEQVADCIRETGIGFLYAPLLHPAVKHAQEARLVVEGQDHIQFVGAVDESGACACAIDWRIFCARRGNDGAGAGANGY